MAYNVTLTQLQTKILQRCHMESSQVVPTTELTQYINDSGTELNDILATAFGAKYRMKRVAFSLQASKDTYDITADIGAADFMLLQGLDVYASGRWIPVREFKMDERQYYQGPAVNLTGVGPLFAYRFQGANLVIAPMPSAAYQAQLWYTPTWTTLVSGSDVVDSIDGWEELIVLDCCIKILAKQDLPVEIFMAQKAGIIQRIEALKQQRDAVAPPRIADVQDSDNLFTTRWRFGV